MQTQIGEMAVGNRLLRVMQRFAARYARCSALAVGLLFSSLAFALEPSTQVTIRVVRHRDHVPFAGAKVYLDRALGVDEEFTTNEEGEFTP